MFVPFLFLNEGAVKLLVGLAMFTGSIASAQVVIDFESGNLENWVQLPSGRWELSPDDPISGERSLHHGYDNHVGDTDLAGMDLLSPDLSDTIGISFRVRHAYNPSSNNNWQLFFLFDDPGKVFQGSGGGGGFILGVNFEGSDDLLKLWQLVGGELFEICATSLNYQETVGREEAAYLRLQRVPEGNWEIGFALPGEPPGTIGRGKEVMVSKGRFAGFRYSYSSAQDRKLWIDDIRIDGHFFADTIPPWIQQHRIMGTNSIHLQFSEPVKAADQTAFMLEGEPADTVSISGQSCRLQFRDPFPNRLDLELEVRNVFDLEGNRLIDTLVYCRHQLAEFGDVVITEVMIDPEPVIYLPPCEYIEVYNRYEEPFFLDAWKVVVNGRTYEVSNDTLFPGEFLVITHEDCADRYPGKKVQPVLGSSTAITNSGGEIRLMDPHDRLIHLVIYESMERYDASRGEGGWSLERLDPDCLCGGYTNWMVSSAAAGGTPGEMNSQQYQVPDHDPPVLLSAGLPGDSLVELTFNEMVMLHQGQVTGIELNGKAFPGFPGGRTLVDKTFRLHPPEALVTGKEYVITLRDVQDCAGNMADHAEYTFRLSDRPSAGSPAINEVMYDPAPGGPEYIELYNPGREYLDLRDLKLGVADAGTWNVALVELSGDSHLMPPHKLVVLTDNARLLREEWALGWEPDVLEVEDWKRLPNDGSCIILTGRAGKTVDRLCYHDSLHHDFLAVTSGVALERIHNGQCDKALSLCWTSAGASAGYGTPGTENSRSSPGEVPAERILELRPQVFSPDNDGFEDLLEIFVVNPGQVVLLDLFVTDLHGRHIRDIVRRGFGGNTDRFFWDGLDQNGKTILPGIYIIHLHVSDGGRKKISRASCAVTYR